MLSTGYDCPEVLNIVLARPIASPTSYIQIKGRGTRKHTFPGNIEKKEFLIHDFCEVVKYFEDEYDFEAPVPGGGGGAGKATPIDTPPGPTEVKTYAGDDSLVFSEIIEVGPEGEKVDRLSYITKWEKVIKDIMASNPEFAQEVNDGNLSEDFEDYLKVQVFDKPTEFFNETNLSKAYKVFADLLDFVKAGLGMEKLPTQEEQLLKLVDSIRIDQDLNLEQVRLLKILVEQVSQSPQLLSQFESGDYSFLDRSPFSNYGGSQNYILHFNGKIQPIFNTIRTSPVVRVV